MRPATVWYTSVLGIRGAPPGLCRKHSLKKHSSRGVLYQTLQERQKRRAHKRALRTAILACVCSGICTHLTTLPPQFDMEVVEPRSDDEDQSTGNVSVPALNSSHADNAVASQQTGVATVTEAVVHLCIHGEAVLTGAMQSNMEVGPRRDAEGTSAGGVPAPGNDPADNAVAMAPVATSPNLDQSTVSRATGDLDQSTVSRGMAIADLLEQNDICGVCHNQITSVDDALWLGADPKHNHPICRQDCFQFALEASDKLQEGVRCPGCTTSAEGQNRYGSSAYYTEYRKGDAVYQIQRRRQPRLTELQRLVGHHHPSSRRREHAEMPEGGWEFVPAAREAHEKQMEEIRANAESYRQNVAPAEGAVAFETGPSPGGSCSRVRPSSEQRDATAGDALPTSPMEGGGPSGPPSANGASGDGASAAPAPVAQDDEHVMISGVEAQGVAAAEQKEWTVAAMYCGCGGESLGCRNAGAKVLCAVDDDEHALKTYGANFPGTQLIRGDLLDDTLRARLIEDWRGRVDVVVGGPPCQPFSIANEHSEEPHYDEMKKHIVSYVKLALALEPRAVIMEVVPKAHKVLPEVRAHFEEAGYAVWHNKLPASKYGVPQERERLIVVACKGERAFVPPSPTTDPPETAGKALARAPVPAKGRPLQGFVRLECVPATTNLNKLAETQRRDRKTFGRENYKVMDLDKPANTITTETWSNTGCFFIQRGNLYHELSVEEAARLQSFPPDFKFMGCETNVRAQIGNAWPPEFARRIMLSLRDMIIELRMPPPKPLAVSGPVSQPPAASQDGETTGGDGGCTAAALANIGVFASKGAAAKALDAQIKPLHAKFVRERGECDESDAGIRGEQWHLEAICEAVKTAGWHFKTVPIHSGQAKCVDLRDTLKDGLYLIIGVVNARFEKHRKMVWLHKGYPANAPHDNPDEWIHSIAVTDGSVQDFTRKESLAALWLQANNQPKPEKGYMRTIRKVWRVYKCVHPGTGCKGDCAASRKRSDGGLQGGAAKCARGAC